MVVQWAFFCYLVENSCQFFQKLLLIGILYGCKRLYSIFYYVLYVQYLSTSSDNKPVEENMDDNCSKIKFKKVQETVEYNCPKVHFSCYLFENSCHKVFQKMCCLLYCMVVRGSIVFFMMYHVQYLSTSSDHKPVEKNIDDNCSKCIFPTWFCVDRGKKMMDNEIHPSSVDDPYLMFCYGSGFAKLPTDSGPNCPLYFRGLQSVKNWFFIFLYFYFLDGRIWTVLYLGS